MVSTATLDRWLAEHVQPGPAHRWHLRRVGTGAAVLQGDGLRLVVPHAGNRSYTNAQLDDYGGLPHRRYPWQPPLRLLIRARFGGPLLGTAGFGFWNHPFVPLGKEGILIPPRAVWFFHASPPNNMAIAQGVPGHGWKAATLDTLGPRALRWAPFAPAVVALNNVPAFERRVWPLVQRDLGIGEAILRSVPHEWHDYTLVWRRDGVEWQIDGRIVHQTDHAPGGPLGFVAWVDNQYAVATRRGRLGYGLLHAPAAQWLDIESIRIERVF